MNDLNKCPRCGTEQPAGSTGGVCPRCAAGLLQATQTDIPGENTGAFIPPTVEELAAKFPQLEIIELIGRGGMGAVYKARQRELDRLVALKILPPAIGQSPAFAERFSREARALAKLNHPGIITIHDFGRADGLYFFLMEFVDGMNLRELLHNGRISAREALAIVPQICDALQFAHDQGIVHRDIKPENLLIDRRGRVKVADFGLAKLMGTEPETAATAGTTTLSPSLTEAGKVMGTPNYMSPEQLERPGEVDHRADIYALGVVFYQMLTGELPDKQLQPPSHKVRIDVRLDEVVMRALEQQPDRRYQHASAMKTQVDTIAQGAAHSAQPISPQWYRGVNYKSKRTFFGLPLVHVASGMNPATGRARIARGIIAIGGIAQGVVAIGGVAMGGFTMGGLSLGVFSYGGLALGLFALGGVAAALVVAFGGLAVAPVSLGGLASGYYSKGGLAIGLRTVDARGQMPAAVHFFAPWSQWVLDHFQIFNFFLVAVTCVVASGVPWWLSRRSARSAPDEPGSGASSRLSKAQLREIYAHMTTPEKAGILIFKAFYGIWTVLTFVLPTLCLFCFRIPYPWNWMVGAAPLVLGLAFCPLWWWIQAKLYCSSASGRTKGLRATSVPSHRGLITGGVLWLAIIGVCWLNDTPVGAWQSLTILTSEQFLNKFRSGQITHFVISYNPQSYPLTEIRGSVIAGTNSSGPTETPFISPTLMLTPKMQDELFASPKEETEVQNAMLWSIGYQLLFFVALPVLIVPMIILTVFVLRRWMGRRSRPIQSRFWGLWGPVVDGSPNKIAQEIYAHMTEREKSAQMPLGMVFGFFNSATLFLPFACVWFFPIPVPLNWIVAVALLLAGLAFYPLFWKRQAAMLSGTAWAREKGYQAESIRTFRWGSTGLLGGAGLYMAVIGVLWWQIYQPNGVWQPWLAAASIKEPNVGGAVCVTGVGNYGQIVWLRLACDSLPRSAGLSPAYTGPLIELPYSLPADATNVDCLITTAPHSRGKVIAGTNDLGGETNFTIGFVLPDEQAAAAAVKQIAKLNVGKRHGFDSPLFVLRRTLGKDSIGNVIDEEVFGSLELQGKVVRSESTSAASDLSASNILASVKQVYASLSTYRDDGWMVQELLGKEWTNRFNEILGARTGYRVEIVTAPVPFSHTNRFWSDGLDFYWQQVPGAIIKGGEITGNLSQTINFTAVPTLYFNLSWGNVFDRFASGTGGLSCLADEKIDGVDCYVILHTNAVDRVKLWVGRQDRLIRRYQHNGFTETHENISLNNEFKREDFVPPVGIAK